MNMVSTSLAWTPLLQPLPGVQEHWLWLLPVLVVGIAMMYKAIRVERMDRWLREVGTMSLQILLAFGGFAVGLALIVQVLVPMFSER